jgi:hypothetical protein
MRIVFEATLLRPSQTWLLASILLLLVISCLLCGLSTLASSRAPWFMESVIAIQTLIGTLSVATFMLHGAKRID